MQSAEIRKLPEFADCCRPVDGLLMLVFNQHAALQGHVVCLNACSLYTAGNVHSTVSTEQHITQHRQRHVLAAASRASNVVRLSCAEGG